MIVISAAQAKHVAVTNPYSEERERRENIMEGIKKYSDLGMPCYSIVGTYRDILQEDVDWLVRLGYMVYRHRATFDASGRALYGYSYSIYWMEDATGTWLIPFAPGERWSSNETSGAV